MAAPQLVSSQTLEYADCQSARKGCDVPPAQSAIQDVCSSAANGDKQTFREHANIDVNDPQRKYEHRLHNEARVRSVVYSSVRNTRSICPDLVRCQLAPTIRPISSSCLARIETDDRSCAPRTMHDAIPGWKLRSRTAGQLGAPRRNMPRTGRSIGTRYLQNARKHRCEHLELSYFAAWFRAMQY